MKKLLVVFILSLFFKTSIAQNLPLTFVHLSDTHIGSETGAEDLRRTVQDINQNEAIQFVIISGDITEFGSDEEIKLAKQILDSLNKTWYIIP
jgi:3',5'-cyclic AMP phosphodiesterase CpdA